MEYQGRHRLSLDYSALASLCSGTKDLAGQWHLTGEHAGAGNGVRREKESTMRRFALPSVLIVMTCIPSLFAITSGTDLLVPAAARGAGVGESTWVTDLYLLNPGDQTVSVEIFWLERNRANPSPVSRLFDIAPGATLVLDDVLLETFGLAAAGGALRVIADGEVVVSSRIYNRQGAVTFGQGFEGVPRSAALRIDDTTDVMGLSESTSFRTNIVLIDASDDEAGSQVELSLRDQDGAEIASGDYQLERLEPRLFSATDLGATAFENATLHAEVTRGSVIVTASKIDNDPATGDPTTLEPWSSPVSADGAYKIAISDSFDYAGGGTLVVSDGKVTALTATYFNWDKVDATGLAECTELFLWQSSLVPAIDLEDFEQGVVVEQTFDGGGHLSFNLTMTTTDNLTISGSVAAIGSSFPLMQAGCNGEFPTLTLSGGKSR
jgi:hypothetical protein